jgi:hypothetical protein
MNEREPNPRCALNIRVYALSAVICGTMLIGSVAQAANRYWVAAAAADWNVTDNWSTTSGGGGGASVPGSADIAFFDGAGGNNGDCRLNIAITVAGIRIESGYSGTVRQEAATLTLTTNGFYQAGGVFAGGTADISTTTGFTLAGGAFTNTSARLTVSYGSPMFSFTGGSFSHNNGTLRFYCVRTASNNTSYDINISKPLTLKHLIYDGGNSKDVYYYTGYILNLTDTGALIVEGDFTMDPVYYLGASGGIIELHGNVIFGSKVSFTRNAAATRLLVNGTGNQTYTSTAAGRQPGLSVNKLSGSFSPAVGTTDLSSYRFELISGDFTAPEGVFDIFELPANINIFSFTGGTYDANNGTLRVSASGTGNRTLTIYLRQPLNLQNLAYTGGSTDGWNTPYSLDIAGSGSLTVDGNFTMQGIKPRANAGTMEVHGNIEIGTGANGGTTMLVLAGADQQELTQTGGTFPGGHLTINKSGGEVKLATDFSLVVASQDLLWQAGNLNLASNTLTVGRNVTISSGTKTLGVTVADAVTAGQLTVAGTASGINNVDLNVLVAASKTDVAGQTYTLLSNNVALNSAFASEIWSAPWRGTVAYTANSGKNVTIFDLAQGFPGSVFVIQ